MKQMAGVTSSNPNQKKFSVAKPPRIGKKSAGTSMAKSQKPPRMNSKSGKSKAC